MNPFGRLSTSTKAGVGPRAGKPVYSAIGIHFPSRTSFLSAIMTKYGHHSHRMDLHEGQAKSGTANHCLYRLVAISSALLLHPSRSPLNVCLRRFRCNATALGQCLLAFAK